MLLKVAISVFAALLLIALVIGLVKGYTKTKTWATEYLFAVVLSVLIYALADLTEMKAWQSAALKIGTAVAFILVFALLSSRGKALFNRCIANARKRSYYEQYGDREENTLQIIDAIESGDAKEYKTHQPQIQRKKRSGWRCKQNMRRDYPYDKGNRNSRCYRSYRFRRDGFHAFTVCFRSFFGILRQRLLEVLL